MRSDSEYQEDRLNAWLGPGQTNGSIFIKIFSAKHLKKTARSLFIETTKLQFFETLSAVARGCKQSKPPTLSGCTGSGYACQCPKQWL